MEFQAMIHSQLSIDLKERDQNSSKFPRLIKEWDVGPAYISDLNGTRAITVRSFTGRWIPPIDEFKMKTYGQGSIYNDKNKNKK